MLDFGSKNQMDFSSTSQPQPHLASSSSPSSSIATPSSEAKRRYKPTNSRSNSKTLVSAESEKALRDLLVSSSRYTKFGLICNTDHSLFGAPGSQYRKAIQNRRTKLLAIQKYDPDEFIRLVRGM